MSLFIDQESARACVDLVEAARQRLLKTTPVKDGRFSGLHVRRFASQQDATQACAAHETSLFPTMTPDVMCRLIRVARRRRIERKGAWLTALHNFLAGSGAGAGRTEKRAAEAGEASISQ